MLILGIFRWDLGSGRVCNRLEMAVGFKCEDSQLISSHMGHYGSILYDFHYFRNFAIDFGGLTLFPEGPRTLRDCPEGPGTV